MINVDLARRLVAEGVLWQPQPGDRFLIDQPTLVDEVFWISELTIDVHTSTDIRSSASTARRSGRSTR